MCQPELRKKPGDLGGKKKKSYDNAVIMEGIASLVLARE